MVKSADGRFEYCDKNSAPLAGDTTLADVGRIRFRCRSDDGSWCSVNVSNAGYNTPQRNWLLTGSFDRPTLSPSINCQDGHCWHGFIEDGIYKDTNKMPEPKQ